MIIVNEWGSEGERNWEWKMGWSRIKVIHKIKFEIVFTVSVFRLLKCCLLATNICLCVCACLFFTYSRYFSFGCIFLRSFFLILNDKLPCYPTVVLIISNRSMPETNIAYSNQLKSYFHCFCLVGFSATDSVFPFAFSFGCLYAKIVICNMIIFELSGTLLFHHKRHREIQKENEVHIHIHKVGKTKEKLCADATNNFILTHKNQKWYFLMIRHFFGKTIFSAFSYVCMHGLWVYAPPSELRRMLIYRFAWKSYAFFALFLFPVPVFFSPLFNRENVELVSLCNWVGWRFFVIIENMFTSEFDELL